MRVKSQHNLKVTIIIYKLTLGSFRPLYSMAWPIVLERSSPGPVQQFPSGAEGDGELDANWIRWHAENVSRAGVLLLDYLVCSIQISGMSH